MYSIEAGDLKLVLNSQGEIINLLSQEGMDYAKGEHVPIASLIKLVMAPDEEDKPSKKDGSVVKPIDVEQVNNRLIFKFANNIVVEVTITEKANYAKLEVTKIDKQNLDIELLMWGPLTTSIKENFGETLGVVYNEQFAIGIRGLNDKTQLTVPFEYAGHVIEGQERLNVSYPQDRSRFKGRVCALESCGASPTSWGTVLQAFTYDATQERIRLVNFVGEKRVPALQGEEAEIVGSAIAIYGKAFKHQTPKEAVLDVIEILEVEEGLPHPLLEGKWQKRTPKATQPYFILGDLSEKTIEKASQYANQANIAYVYKDTLFTSNGSYNFAGGDTAMKAMVEKAAAYGIKVGSHSLSGFIDYRDDYTTRTNKGQFAGEPLAKLQRDIKVGDEKIWVDHQWRNLGQTKQIGDELVEVLEEIPCEVGYQITLKNPMTHMHMVGEWIWGLHNNQYGGLGAGVEQTRAIASRLARACNDTGMSQISFDGVEIGEYNGYSHYSVNQIINQFYNQLDPVIQAGIISDSSGGYPNAWHVNTRQNWGEPWGAQMREGMIDYRYDNQLYFERNFTPKMLGWFMYEEGQPTIDIEWMLAKSAGFDAGYALVTSTEILDKNGNTPEVLEAVKEWQKARACGAFTKDQMKRLLDTKKDWHLEKTEIKDRWQLYCINYPSQPTMQFVGEKHKGFEYFNPYPMQPLHFEVQARNGAITQFAFKLEGEELVVNHMIPEQGYLVYTGKDIAFIYDQNWHVIEEIAMAAKDQRIIQAGLQMVAFDFEAENSSVQAALRIITQSQPEDVFVGNREKNTVQINEHEILEGPTTSKVRAKEITLPEIITYRGIMPKLPRQIQLGQDVEESRLAVISWPEVDGKSYQEVGRINIEGKIEGVVEQARVNVVVTDKPLAVLSGPESVNEAIAQTITLTYGIQGVEQASSQDIQIYFDKEVFAFNKEGKGIQVKADHTKLYDFNVNNESAIIDLHLESYPTLSDLEEILELTFSIKKQGVGKIALKQVRVSQDEIAIESIVTQKEVIVYHKH